MVAAQGGAAARAAVTPGWRIFEGDTFKVRLVVADVFSRSAEAAAIIPLGATELHALSPPQATAGGRSILKPRVRHLPLNCGFPRAPRHNSPSLTRLV